jgi:hypothetical protein
LSMGCRAGRSARRRFTAMRWPRSWRRSASGRCAI